MKIKSEMAGYTLCHSFKQTWTKYCHSCRDVKYSWEESNIIILDYRYNQRPREKEASWFNNSNVMAWWLAGVQPGRPEKELLLKYTTVPGGRKLYSQA